MSQQAMHEQWYAAQAEAQAIANWLNCYLREFALPHGQADMDYRGLDRPAGLALAEGKLLRIGFGQPGYALCVRLGYGSRLGRCTYASVPYLKTPGEAWRCADARGTIHFLLERLTPACGFNAELLAQSDNSIAITRHLLQRSAASRASGDALIDAEQGMLWGHAMHPTPKSREGVPLEQVLACSPEVRTGFPLYWFRIDPRLLRVLGRDVRATLADVAGGEHLYPCHPWEVERMLAHPLLQQAQERGWIEPLGTRGAALQPTSSVRTLYRADLDYFLKMSIHVRLTNCVRKNAWYELESAVAITELLEPVWRDVGERVPGFGVLLEPAATTLDFSALGGDEEAQRELAESFGILYRDNLGALVRERYHPQVAGALFTTDRHGASVCKSMLRQAASAAGYPRAAIAWFEAYAGLLLDGVWLAFFRHGVVLEPHLQNTVIGFDRGMPSRVWVRDLEGTKLVEERWPASRLGGLSERARQSVHYSQALGWKRVAYCALVNNLAEAIFHLADGDPALEDRLWDVIGATARRWQERFGAQPLLQGLQQGEPLPSKNNLRTRLFKRADRDSDYTYLPNPIHPQTAALQVA